MDKYRVRLPIEELVMAFGPEKMSPRRAKRDNDEPSVISVMENDQSILEPSFNSSVRFDTATTCTRSKYSVVRSRSRLSKPIPQCNTVYMFNTILINRTCIAQRFIFKVTFLSASFSML